ncbi:hypothetical protein JOS77_10495 [Chromobacterium haemolyticum]|nr:hypothetical protein JOS77_10495 [Chromobacterium haemolyticum]
MSMAGAGLLFGLGLLLSGMGNPAKVLAFLDLGGAWDPSLALVMAGAVAMAWPAFRLAVWPPPPARLAGRADAIAGQDAADAPLNRRQPLVWRWLGIGRASVRDRPCCWAAWRCRRALGFCRRWRPACGWPDDGSGADEVWAAGLAARLSARLFAGGPGCGDWW